MKNWVLFLWAFERLDIENDKCKRSLKNNFLLWLMDLSGVKPADVWKMLREIKNEINRREGLA